jgi:short-subunit dehydrogenase
MNTKTSYALVTGSSGGIGKAIAIELAKRGNNLLLIARSETELAKVKQKLAPYKVLVEYLPIDLALPDANAVVMKWIRENRYGISILVNNAGAGVWGNFLAVSLERQLNVMQLNMSTLVSLTYLIVPLLQEQEHSYVLNVASIGAYCPSPKMSVYVATKAFVLLFSKSLRSELKESSVSVSCLSPGPVDTGFLEKANMHEKLKRMTRQYGMTPQRIAEIGVKGMFNKRKEIIPGFMSKIIVWAAWLFPESWNTKVAAHIYK